MAVNNFADNIAWIQKEILACLNNTKTVYVSIF